MLKINYYSSSIVPRGGGRGRARGIIATRPKRKDKNDGSPYNFKIAKLPPKRTRTQKILVV